MEENLYTVRLYNEQDKAVWNNFVHTAKNATFLFERDYMEYHKDRFDDFSLLVFDKKDNLVALVPANRVENTVYSHNGLTYGGVIIKKDIKLIKYIHIFKSILKYLNTNKIDSFFVKEIPPIYCDTFSGELMYTLFLCNAKLMRCDSLSVLDLQSKYHIKSNRKEGIKRGINNHLIVKNEQDFSGFFNQILIPNMLKKHKVLPIHTLDEMQMLHNKFPKNIQLYTVYKDNEILAGTVVYISKKVVHAQYIFGNETKNQHGAIDYLHYHLITQVFTNKKYYDFGTSNEYYGRKLNEGLCYWKSTFDSQTVSQSFYEVATENHTILDSVFI